MVTLFDKSIPSLLETPTTVVATQNVTEDPPLVAVNFRFPIAPAPVPVGLAAVPAAFLSTVQAVAPTSLVAPDIADARAPEAQVLERPYFLLRMFDFLTAQMILFLMMLYFTLERYGTLLIT